MRTVWTIGVVVCLGGVWAEWGALVVLNLKREYICFGILLKGSKNAVKKNWSIACIIV